jgi:Na+-translocating ferredoxin:NAD+ oxidoreductase RnfG subunit
MKVYSLFSWLIILLLAFVQKSTAQDVTKQNTSQRAQQVLSVLDISDADKESKVRTIISSYLDSLENVISVRKAKMEAASQSSENQELNDARSQAAWNAAAGKLNKLHATFLGKLSSLLTRQQVDLVKDQMTENRLRAEYNRFLELLPDLTEQHKSQVMIYLVEARENAMDAETEDMRGQWFIKYRGRANNFLAAVGYDLRKATEVLEQKKQVIRKTK